MVYALMISLLISSILGAYIWINYYQQGLLNRYYAAELAYENLQSGRLLFLNRDGQIGARAAMQLFSSEYDSCYIASEYWGLLGLLHATGSHRSTRVSESCFVGQQSKGLRKASLLLTDNKQVLNLVGKTYLEGELYVPASGLKAGYIGRKSYEGDSLFYGKSQSSRGLSLSLDMTYMSIIKQLLTDIHDDTTLTDSYYLRNADFQQSWADSALIFRSQSTVILRNVSIQGKCMIITSGEILVERTAQLTDVLLFARRIRIKEDVIGRFQVFATEGIYVEKEVQLNYPSILMLSRFDDKAGRIEIGSKSQIEGAVIFDTQLFGAARDRLDYCLIEQKAEIWGNVEVQHNLDLRGAVMGHVMTNNFLLKTPSAVYRNYLLDAYISSRPLHQTYAMPLIQEGRNFRIIDVLGEW